MSRFNCEVIRDLLPLYADGVCSELSEKTVREHLAECRECAAELEKMNRKVSVEADKDISAIRKIKKRMKLTKIAVAAVAALLLFSGLFGGYIWAVTDCSMDYEKYNIAENVRVEEDADGTLWFCMKGNAAAMSSYLYPTVSDTDGGHMGYGEQSFNKEKMAGYGITLKMFRIAKLVPWSMESTYEVRAKLNFRDGSKIKYVFYYDDATGTEHVLWGEKPGA